MFQHFKHPRFENLEFESVPRNQDVYLMDEQWIPEWEDAHLRFFSGEEWRAVGYISYAAVRSASFHALEISWYPNVFDRFHEVKVVLPRDAFVACIDVYDSDGKPYIFVKGEWLTALHIRPYSAFALVDAIGVKKALMDGSLSGGKLIALRDKIDEIAEANPRVAFVSFADSILLKTNWFVGQYDSEINYSYEPEALIRVFPQIAVAYKELLGMDVYATIAQGVNEYSDSALIHQSASGGHLSLNSLGLPFAQVLAIDEAARDSIRKGIHGPYELYMDEMFFRSLRLSYGFDKRGQPNATYQTPMSSTPGTYYCTSAETILKSLGEPGARIARSPPI